MEGVLQDAYVAVALGAPGLPTDSSSHPLHNLPFESPVSFFKTLDTDECCPKAVPVVMTRTEAKQWKQETGDLPVLLQGRNSSQLIDPKCVQYCVLVDAWPVRGANDSKTCFLAFVFTNVVE